MLSLSKMSVTREAADFAREILEVHLGHPTRSEMQG